MQIKLLDCPKGMEYVTERNGDELVVRLVEKKLPALGSMKPGEKFKIDDWEFVCLKHCDDGGVFVASADYIDHMSFGEDNNYPHGNVDEFLSGEPLERLIEAVGEKNIFSCTIDLVALDGSNRDVTCERKLFAPTLDMCREYAHLLPLVDRSYWMSTPWSTREGYSRSVCCVGSGGTVYWDCCDWYGNGVRPFCKLNSSILVERSE